MLTVLEERTLEGFRCRWVDAPENVLLVLATLDQDLWVCSGQESYVEELLAPGSDVAVAKSCLMAGLPWAHLTLQACLAQAFLLRSASVELMELVRVMPTAELAALRARVNKPANMMRALEMEAQYARCVQ